MGRILTPNRHDDKKWRAIDWTKLRPRFTKRRTPHQVLAEKYRHGAIRPSGLGDRGGWEAAKDAEMKMHGRTRGKVLRCLQRSRGSPESRDRTCGKLSDYPAGARLGDRGGWGGEGLPKGYWWDHRRPPPTPEFQFQHRRWRPPPYLSGSYGDLGGTFVGGSKFNRSGSLPNRDAARKAAMAYYKPPVLHYVAPHKPPEDWRRLLADRGGRKTKSLGGLSIAEWLKQQNGGRRPCPMKKCMVGYGCGKPDRWGCSGCGKCPDRNPIYT